MDIFVVLVLVVGGYYTINLILNHREKMTQLKLGIVPKDEDEEE